MYVYAQSCTLKKLINKNGGRGVGQRHTYMSCGINTQILSMKLLMSCGKWLQEIPPFLQLLYTWDLALSTCWNLAGNVRCHAERKSEVRPQVKILQDLIKNPGMNPARNS